MTKRKHPKPAHDLPTPATPEFAQHHDVDARPGSSGQVAGWRVRTRLDRLLADGHITASEWQAGDHYRSDYEHGELGASMSEPGMPRGGSGSGCPTASRLDALNRLRHARAKLQAVEVVVMDMLAQDQSWSAVMRRVHVVRLDDHGQIRRVPCERSEAIELACSALTKLDHRARRKTTA